MFHRLKSINKNQRGFTLIELIVAIAITGLIISAITVTIFQLFSISARSDSHMLAVRQVQNAGYWISHDTQMAQSVETDGGTTGFPLKLTWSNEWDSNTYQVVYNLIEADSELRRSYKVNDDDPNVTLVAEYIDQAETSCGLTGGGTFTLPDKDDAFTITGDAVADSGKITVATGSIKVTTNGSATYKASTASTGIWTTPDANGTVVVKAFEAPTAGVWTSTTANAKVAITTDTDDENAIITGRVLTLMVTATVSGWHEVTETRVYEVIHRPD